jgi:hypothetical protein
MKLKFYGRRQKQDVDSLLRIILDYNVENPVPYLGETLKYGEVQHNYVIQAPVGNGISNGIAHMRNKTCMMKLLTITV